MSAPFLAIEWATTQLRARVLTPDGVAVGEYREPAGLANLGREAIAALLELVASRLPEAGPILLSGMIGSAMGWREIPRIACPASAVTIAAGVVEEWIGARQVFFVPGLRCTSRFG